MNRSLWRGPALVVIAALHTAFNALVASGAGYTPELMEVAGGSPPLSRLVPGVGSANPPDMPALAFFWSLSFGVAMALIGLLVLDVERQGGRASTVTGALLLALAVVGAALAPASGFWLVMPIAVSLIRRSRTT